MDKLKRHIFLVAFSFLALFGKSQDYLNYFPTTDGYVFDSAIDSVRKRLLIIGDFSSVNGVPASRFAAIDLVTGNVVPSQYIDLSGSFASPNSIEISGSNVYIGFFDYGVFPINADSYAPVFNVYPSVYGSNPRMPDFTISDKHVVMVDCKDTSYLGNSPIYLAGISVYDTVTSSYWSVFTNKNYNTSVINKVLVAGNTIYIGGNFVNVNGVPRKGLAAIDLNSHLVKSWNPSLSSFCGDANNVTDMALINGELHVITSLAGCNADTTKVYRIDTLTGNFINTIGKPGYGDNRTGFYLTSISKYDESNFIVSGDLAGSMGNFTHNRYAKISTASGLPDTWNIDTMSITYGRTTRLGNYLSVALYDNPNFPAQGRTYSVFCIPPQAPAAFTSATTNICVNGQTLNYQVSPVSSATGYIWTYSGTGVAITTNGNNADLQFNIGAALGAQTLTVRAINECGSLSDSLNIAITLNETPTINSIPDSLLTCARDTIVLTGSSDITPAINATYQWKDPNNTITTINPLNATISGNYILTATNSSSGCFRTDTLTLSIDTLKPSLGIIANSFGILCSPNYVVVNQTSSNTHASIDTTWWQSPSNSVLANPLNTSVIGNYVFHAQDPYNGCESTDTITVFNNNTPPNINLPASIDTLTCIVDSVIVSGSSSTTSTRVYWVQLATNDTLTNPFYADTIGAYKLVVIDTANNCSSSGFANVNEYITPPNLSIINNNPSVNCSNSSATITGNTLTPGATLLWTGPSAFSSGNPTTTGVAGTYTLTATDNNNGCTKSDSIVVLQQQILIMNNANDTTICYNSSASLTSSAIGGTTPFTYSWDNGAGNNQTATVNPVTTTNYILTVTDAAGCIGKDTISVNVPPALNDSTLSFQPCDTANPNGQIQIFAYGGIPPYQYSINNGISFQPSQVFTNLNYGTYPIVVMDSLLCNYSHNVIINQLSNTPLVDFIVSTNLMQGDTFVVVDISNPRPDTVIWTFPSFVQVLNTDPFNPIILSSDTGMFTLNMEAHFGSCIITINKNVQFIKSDTSFANSYNNNGIQSISVNPNPNSGQFTLEVKLYKKQSFVTSIISSSGAELLRQVTHESDLLVLPVQLTNVADGTYYIKVIAEYDAKTKTFVIGN